MRRHDLVGVLTLLQHHLGQRAEQGYVLVSWRAALLQIVDQADDAIDFVLQRIRRGEYRTRLSKESQALTNGLEVNLVAVGWNGLQDIRDHLSTMYFGRT